MATSNHAPLYWKLLQRVLPFGVYYRNDRFHWCPQWTPDPLVIQWSWLWWAGEIWPTQRVLRYQLKDLTRDRRRLEFLHLYFDGAHATLPEYPHYDGRRFVSLSEIVDRLMEESGDEFYSHEFAESQGVYYY